MTTTAILWLMFPVVFFTAVAALIKTGFYPDVSKGFVWLKLKQLTFWFFTKWAWIASNLLGFFYLGYLVSKLFYKDLKIGVLRFTLRKFLITNRKLILDKQQAFAHYGRKRNFSK